MTRRRLLLSVSAVASITDYIVFNDDKLARKYESDSIPMSVLYESYFDGDIDIPGDLLETLQHREEFIKYTITRQNLQWAMTNFVPDMVHTKQQDVRLIRDTYDRGNDFFGWLLGQSMVYSAACFDSAGESLEDAQRRQFLKIGELLQLNASDRFLDLGCGWGTFVRHVASHVGAHATGVTLAEKQADYAEQLLSDEGLNDKTRILRSDYRDLQSDQKYDKIVCLEMIEHVGVKNLTAFGERVYDLLDDDGLFFLQWTGLRRVVKQEDLIWGLFISKYIFPGADASLPPSAMLKALEKAGLELHWLNNTSAHYACTLRAWRRNWARNREAILAAYGERWYRIWSFFLAWSVLIAESGNASCYQAVFSKNTTSFNRGRWLDAGTTKPVPH